MNLKTQKRMAAKILDCGKEKVWIDPEQLEEVSKAITNADIRRLVQTKVIQKKKENQQSRSRARKILKKKREGKRKGRGSRKGSAGAATSKKELWMIRVRSLRRKIKELRNSEKIDRKNYRGLYKMINGGLFRNKAHLMLYLKEHNLLKKGMINEKSA